MTAIKNENENGYIYISLLSNVMPSLLPLSKFQRPPPLDCLSSEKRNLRYIPLPYQRRELDR